MPIEVELEEWHFDANAGPAPRGAESRLVHGQSLKAGDVARTEWRLRCAQSPYDTLPVPRADIPAGVILSREANAWIREELVEDTALPLFEGRMIGPFDFSQKGWVSGKGRGAVWRDVSWELKRVEPQFLMGIHAYGSRYPSRRWPKVGYMDVASGTNKRTTFATVLADWPCGNRVNLLRPRTSSLAGAMSGVLNSVAFDWAMRQRLTGIIINWFIAAETPLPLGQDRHLPELVQRLVAHLSFGSAATAPLSISILGSDVPRTFCVAQRERLARICIVESLVALWFGLTSGDMLHLLRDVDLPVHEIRNALVQRKLDPKGFWRVDKDKDPELRHTVLTLVAFHDLEERIRACGGDRDAGIEAFIGQNGGEGWMLPERLRLADYGLGHDERATQPQPVASRLGPRFYDWQLTQTAEESWRECHLHARNLLGEQAYSELLDEIQADGRGEAPSRLGKPRVSQGAEQRSLFE